MIVSSDLIARDPRVSSRFNFSEKKTHSPRSFAALAFGLCDRQRESRVHDGRGGEGRRAGARARSRIRFETRRPWLTDPFNRGTFASPDKQTSSGQRLERCRNRRPSFANRHFSFYAPPREKEIDTDAPILEPIEQEIFPFLSFRLLYRCLLNIVSQFETKKNLVPLQIFEKKVSL